MKKNRIEGFLVSLETDGILKADQHQWLCSLNSNRLAAAKM